MQTTLSLSKLHQQDKLSNFNTSKSLRTLSLNSKKSESYTTYYNESSSYENDCYRKSPKRHDPKVLSNPNPKEELKVAIPMIPIKVLKDNPGKFSEFEKKEILQYPEIYFISKSIKKHNGKFDDEKEYYRTFVGDQIAYRYEIIHLVGEGSFGIVISCYDHRLQTHVAIKILRKGKDFEELGELEVNNINNISRDSDDDVLIEKYDHFIFRNHFCIVFELLSLDLYKFLQKNNHQGMSVNVTKRIAVQLIIGLKQIHHSGYIHCDLKPENILFKAINKSSVKIIDFGSACEENNKIFTYIQSRYYRAPEVILGIDYTNKIDI